MSEKLNKLNYLHNVLLDISFKSMKSILMTWQRHSITCHTLQSDNTCKVSKELQRPSRVMSILLDHEAWYSGEDMQTQKRVAMQFPDYAKYYTAQSIGRRYLMDTHKVQIEIAGNSDLG